jgi:hypothetical protein
MTQITHPAADEAGAGERRVETFSYDTDAAGDEWQGLWAELYENDKPLYLPVHEKIWAGPIDNDWGQGSPPQIGDDDTWSIRFTGFLDLRDKANDKKYGFKVFSNDGVTVTVAGKTLTDCFGQSQGAGVANCGTDEAAYKRLWPGLKPITIEYSELTGAANIQLKWDQGTGTWVTISQGRYRPDIGLLTRKTTTTGVVDGQTIVRQTIYDYPTDAARASELPAAETVRQAGGADARTTSFLYDDFGRPEQITTAAGTSLAATTTNVYTDTSTTS